MRSPQVVALCERLAKLAGDIPPDQYWRQVISTGPQTKGLEACADDPASRSWVYQKPKGWSGRDYVRAVHLRTANLPTAALPSNPAELRRCRGGCDTTESLPHVLQSCPVTHGDRIWRHNEVVKKIGEHCRREGWQVEEEPHVRGRTGQLFKPDLVIHRDPSTVVICDVQISWEGNRPLSTVREAKKTVYDHALFNEAAAVRWPTKEPVHAPIIVGARGIWPRANKETELLLNIRPPLKASCVHSALKWGSTLHRVFMRAVWCRQHRQHP